MRLSVPPVKGVDVKHRIGFVGQLMDPERDIEGEWTRFVLPSVTGHMLMTARRRSDLRLPQTAQA